MHVRSVAYVLGVMILITAGAMILPLVSTFFYEENDRSSLLISLLLISGVGLPLWLQKPENFSFRMRDAIVVAVLGWILIPGLSALPFIIHGSIPSLTDAIFEMVSGFTTTGATILDDIEFLPHGLLFWRSETQFLGGIGVLVLTLAFLPQVMGVTQIFRVPISRETVHTRERPLNLNPELLAFVLGIYLALNTCMMLMLYFGGMSFFDSICHAFGTIATAGFSTRNESLGFYGSAYMEWVTMLFMFLGGINFVLYFHLLKRHWNSLSENTELKWYFWITIFFCALVSLLLHHESTAESLWDSVRMGSFHVISMLTTTGLFSSDYQLWSHTVQMQFIAVCLIGACAGSTTSGIKIVHYAIIWKYVVLNIKKIFFDHHAIAPIRLNHKSVEPYAVNMTLCFFTANMFLIFIGACILVLLDRLDFHSSISMVIATLMNIGPGFDVSGPTGNYAHLSDPAKWFLAFMMLVGRLEMFSVFVILAPSFWRQAAKD